MKFFFLSSSLLASRQANDRSAARDSKNLKFSIESQCHRAKKRCFWKSIQILTELILTKRNCYNSLEISFQLYIAGCNSNTYVFVCFQVLDRLNNSKHARSAIAFHPFIRIRCWLWTWALSKCIHAAYGHWPKKKERERERERERESKGKNSFSRLMTTVCFSKAFFQEMCWHSSKCTFN